MFGERFFITLYILKCWAKVVLWISILVLLCFFLFGCNKPQRMMISDGVAGCVDACWEPFREAICPLSADEEVCLEGAREVVGQCVLKYCVDYNI